MEIGIIGLPMVGKTTLFNLLTNAEVEISNFYSGRTDTNVGMAKVPDPRLDFLTELYKPKKTTYPQIQFVDVVGLVRGASKGEGVGNEFLNAIRNSDALLHALRAFDNPDVPHIEDSVDPLRDLETLNTELLLSDLDLIEKRLERIAIGKKRKEQEVEIQLLHRCKEALEAEKPLHTLEMTPEEEGYLRSYQFLTQKPVILVVNVDEEQFKKKDYPGKAKLRE
jgi:GTP-binding protein YchF